MALGLLGIDDDQAVLAPVDRPCRRTVDAGSVVAVLARLGQVPGLDDGVLAPLLALDVHPAMAGPRLRHRVRWEVVAYELVLVGEEAVVAVVAAGTVDDHVPLLHLACPSHFSTWSRAELLAIAVDVGVMKRLGARILTQPEVSGE